MHNSSSASFVNISDDGKLGQGKSSEKYDLITYKPHPVIARLKETFQQNKVEDGLLNNSKGLSSTGSEKEAKNSENNATSANSSSGQDSLQIFSNIVEKLEVYYEEKMKIEVAKIKVHFEKEMLQLMQQQPLVQQPQPQQKCCCNCGSQDKVSSDLKMVLNSMNQVNSNLQKRNEELTNQLLTILFHLKNDQSSNKEDILEKRPLSARAEKEKRKSMLCNIM